MMAELRQGVGKHEPHRIVAAMPLERLVPAGELGASHERLERASEAPTTPSSVKMCSIREWRRKTAGTPR